MDEGSEETLRDGRVVTVRPLRAGDAAGVEALWRRLDARARRRFTDLAHLPSERAGDVALPRPGHAAGIVAIAPAGPVAGVARYERTAGDAAGFLVFVDASWRRAGLGTVLLRRLAGAASHAGVRQLAGDLPEGDVAMRGLLAELGLEYTEQVTAATVHASFAVQETGCLPGRGAGRPARRGPRGGRATAARDARKTGVTPDTELAGRPLRPSPAGLMSSAASDRAARSSSGA